MPTVVRSEYLKIRVTSAEKLYLEKASAESGRTLSEFCRDTIMTTLINPDSLIRRESLEAMVNIGLLTQYLIDKTFGESDGAEIKARAVEISRHTVEQILSGTFREQAK